MSALKPDEPKRPPTSLTARGADAASQLPSADAARDLSEPLGPPTSGTLHDPALPFTTRLVPGVDEPPQVPPPDAPYLRGPGGNPQRRYTLIKKLGGGGFGEVWLALAPDGREVALKLIDRSKTIASEKELAALELLKGLDHPNILRIQDFWTDDQYVWILMDLAEGTLLDRMPEVPHREDGIPIDDLLRYMRETAEALEYLHGEKVIHRDIKPANLLLLQHQVKVADFGLARIHDPMHAATVVGTPPYMAPEIVSSKEVSPRSDQYSLAMTYIELRTGHNPNEGLGFFAIMKRMQEGKGPDLSKIQLAKERKVLQRALAHKPVNRYGSCREFVAALEAVFALPATLPVTVPSRRRWLGGVLTGGGAIAAGLVIWLLIPPPQQSPAKRYDWMPKDSIAAPEATPEFSHGLRVPSQVILGKGGEEFHFLFIRPGEDHPANLVGYYVLRDKVTRRQFAVGWNSSEFQNRLKLLQARCQWLPTHNPLESSSDPGWPQFNVNVVQAQVFCEWLGGRLPTSNEWMKAAGKYRKDWPAPGPFRLPEGWGKYDPDRIPQNWDWIALKRSQPLPAGIAPGDESHYRCRDMAGNGMEWTNADEKGNALDFENLKKDMVVKLLGQGYGDSIPFRFTDEEQSRHIDEHSNLIGFRAVIDVSSSR